MKMFETVLIAYSNLITTNSSTYDEPHNYNTKLKKQYCMILQQPPGNKKKQVVQETIFKLFKSKYIHKFHSPNIQRDTNFSTFKSE